MIDPITKYILEREALSTAIKRIGKCDWKCDRMLKMHEKRAAILLADKEVEVGDASDVGQVFLSEFEIWIRDDEYEVVDE